MKSKESKSFLSTLSDIRPLIHIVRGQQVMLDADLAALYGYSTKQFNRQVKNNGDKFDADFMFQLKAEEVANLRCKNCTSSWGGSRYLPYAFTEQGVYMLMTVLKGELATRQSKAIVRTFKQMKDYIVNNQNLLGERELVQLSLQTADNVRQISDLKLYRTEDSGFVEGFCPDCLSHAFYGQSR